MFKYFFKLGVILERKIKLLLLPNDVSIHLKHPRDSTNKLLKRKFS